MDEVILVINAGSSNIKFAIFEYHTLSFVENDLIEVVASRAYHQSLSQLLTRIETLAKQYQLKAVGHRVVHGGTHFLEPVCITQGHLEKMHSLSPLAPLHQPYNLKVIEMVRTLDAHLPQVACFDTAYHCTQQPLAKLFAIPRVLTEAGILRYGFHGLSYEYIASVLPEYLQARADGKVIVAHLGHGASLCAMNERRSVATSMGFTALEGLMMGTRSGSIDPGVLLYLLQEKKMTVEALTSMLYHESGLLGVSNLSSDMRILQSSHAPYAREAVDLFCYRVIRELSALCGILQGCDAIIFTAGIGEHAAIVRKKICDGLKWLGVILDEIANQSHQTIISRRNSSILVAVIPTNEAYVIAQHTKHLIRKNN